MNWEPFVLAPTGEYSDSPRSIQSLEGIGDRLRAAAFAEIQAREAFLWAADRFDDATPELKQAWRSLAKAEDKHLHWLLDRMTELKISVSDRRVSDRLFLSLMSCKTAREFALFMAGAEERGQRAGQRFHQNLLTIDPITAKIFEKIAEEETAHIALASRHFPETSFEFKAV